jgi:pyrrolidone-carboxylate peptidase
MQLAHNDQFATILVTSFEPFPGARFNPNTPLVKRLARRRRLALAGVTVMPLQP